MSPRRMASSRTCALASLHHTHTGCLFCPLRYIHRLILPNPELLIPLLQGGGVTRSHESQESPRAIASVGLFLLLRRVTFWHSRSSGLIHSKTLISQTNSVSLLVQPTTRLEVG